MLVSIKSFFHIDPIAVILLALISYIGVCVGSFASRYMKGDSRYRIFFIHLILLILSTGIMVSADHIALLFGGWCVSNFLLLQLMVHKSSWNAARNSGRLAGKNYFLGALCVGAALLLLYFITGETSVRAIVQKDLSLLTLLPTFFLLLIAAMTQSAIWPFHRWLLSSLNSPTPVSALMHAGLVNGGGFLLARFAPLYMDESYLMTMIFVVGIATACLGTFWKLIQNDVKRMLACSTMGQMGFMMAQCGLGLFPAAIAHLVSHGMFKAYLFLASGGAAREKRHDLSYPPKISLFAIALVCGLLGSFSFSWASGKSWGSNDTTLVLMVIAFLAMTQAALPILAQPTRWRIPVAVVVTSGVGWIYGASMALIGVFLRPMHLMSPQPLNVFHIGAIALMVALWLSVLFLRNNEKIGFLRPWIWKGYVKGLNASQPHPDTITAVRNQYKYV